MPIYELQCVDCKIIEEKLLTSYINFITEEEYIKILESSVDIKFDNFQHCSLCAGFQELIPSLTAIQPDSFWSGKETEQGTFSSKSQYNKFLKEKNLERIDRSIIEEVQKKSANKINEFKKESEIRVTQFLAKELAEVDI